MIGFRGWRRIRTEVLGMNRRNLDLIQRYNEGPLFAVVDHKQQTKAALSAAGLPVPATYAMCGRHGDLYAFAEEMERRAEFVLKPARGAGGEGVLVVAGRDGDSFRTANGRRIGRRELLAHAADILAGAYALSQARDDAVLEYRLRSAPEMEPLSVGGVADIRIVVYRGVPMMAMLRLPTRASNGRANLHSGGIGVGLDLRTGKTGHAIWRGRVVEVHPDTGVPLRGWSVPAWPEMLQFAARAYDALPLGYFGVDIVLDAARGPVILELNARPGLAIQLSTRQGLRPLVEAVQRVADVEKRSAEERVAVGLQLPSSR